MIFFILVILLAAAFGAGLLAAMVRRVQPHLGVWGLEVLLGAGVLATVYAVLDA